MAQYVEVTDPAILSQFAIPPKNESNDLGYLSKLAKVESANNPLAKNALSSATGAYQMTRGTFNQLQKSNPFLGSISWEEHQQDPGAQQLFAHALTAQNDIALRKAGLQTDNLNRYLTHFAGSQGGIRLAQADPNARARDILGEQFARANPTLANLTVGQIRDQFNRRLTKAKTGGSMHAFEEGGLVEVTDPAILEKFNAQTNSPLPPAKPANKGTDQLRDLKRHSLGLFQGAIADPIAAVAQFLPDNYGGNLANRQLQWYADKRKELGGEGFDASRTIGNVAGTFVPVLGAAGKLGQAAKGAGLVRQGVISGAAAGALQPVLSEEGGAPSEDQSFVGEKATQVGLGGLFGGALNKIIGTGAPALQRAFSNKGNLPATPQQLANQAPKKLSTAEIDKLTPDQKIEYFRQEFPDVPLTWGQAIGPRAQEFEQRLTSAPFLGGVISEARRKGLERQNISMMNKALEPAGLKVERSTGAGRGLFDDAYDKLTDGYRKVLDDVELPRPDVLRGKIVGTGRVDPVTGDVDLGVVGNRYQTLSEEGKKRFDNILEKQLFERFGKDPSGAHSVRMTGTQFKNHEENIKEFINNFSQGTGEERLIGGMLKDALGEAYSSLQNTTGKAGVDSQLKNLNKAYAQFKTLEKASTAGGGTGGIFTPTQTIRAAQKGNTARVARGQGLLQPEAELAQTVLGKAYPDSGTAGRIGAGSPYQLAKGFLAGLGAELAYNPALIRFATGTGTNLGRAFEGTRVGSHLARNAPRYGQGLTSYQQQMHSRLGQDEGDEDHAIGGLVGQEPMSQNRSPLSMVVFR